MAKRIDHNHPTYQAKRMSGARYNGAYYYSIEIVDNIIPLVETNRPWVTVNIGRSFDNAIYFIHNNVHPEHYKFLKDYKNQILICGVPETCEKVREYGTPVYLPLSIDTEYIKRFRVEKIPGTTIYAGRKTKLQYGSIPDHVKCVYGLPRKELLRAMAPCENVYAVGRCALEAKALVCNILPYDSRFPNPGFWQVVDNREAGRALNEVIKAIDGS